MGDRVNVHFRRGANHPNKRLANIFRKSERLGLSVLREIVFETEDEAAAFRKERELIADYGRESLCNLTDGGEGLANPSVEARAKISAAMTGRTLTPEHRAKISAAGKGHYRAVNYIYTAEHRANIAAAARGRPMSAENREMHSALMRARMADPETREAMRASVSRALENPEVRAKISAALRGNKRAQGRVVSDETRERIRASKLGKPRSQETRAKISATRKVKFAALRSA